MLPASSFLEVVHDMYVPLDI